MPPLRPRIPLSTVSSEFLDLLEHCWDENPNVRPTFARIKIAISQTLRKTGDNIVDHLINSMERQTTLLEADIATKLRQFMDEKERSEDMLSQILPKSVRIYAEWYLIA